MNSFVHTSTYLISEFLFLVSGFCDCIEKDGEVETGSNARGKQDQERNSGHSKYICAMCHVLILFLRFSMRSLTIEPHIFDLHFWYWTK